MYPLILTVPSLIEKERCKYALKTLLDMDLAIFDKLLAGHPEATNFSSAVAPLPPSLFSHPLPHLFTTTLPFIITLLCHCPPSLSSVLHNPSLKIFMQSLDV